MESNFVTETTMKTSPANAETTQANEWKHHATLAEWNPSDFDQILQSNEYDDIASLTLPLGTKRPLGTNQSGSRLIQFREKDKDVEISIQLVLFRQCLNLYMAQPQILLVRI